MIEINPPAMLTISAIVGMLFVMSITYTLSAIQAMKDEKVGEWIFDIAIAIISAGLIFYTMISLITTFINKVVG